MIEERAPRLDAYRKKRDPERTPEPFGGRRPAGGRLFVVQKHAARRLHYDLRLEMDGVLKSWAVPKGPSVRPHEKRLAVHVEDHPIEYAEFEGVIPKDNYGAGAVIVWDTGTYRNLNEDVPIEKALEAGHVAIWLYGEKLQGGWTLQHTDGRRWLLIKRKDEKADARRNPVSTQPESVLSGKKIEEI